MISSFARAALALAIAGGAAVCAADSIQVQINGEAVKFPDTQPRMIGSVVMVPIRSVCEQMGATVTWDPDTQTVTCSDNGSNVILRIGDSEATVDGQMRYLDLPPTVVGDRTLVPMRLFGEALGSQVTWIADSDLVAINTSADSTTSASNESNAGPVTLTQDEVVPVTLDTPLDSSSSNVGDTFTATVSGDGSAYADLPKGTKVEGHVAAVQPMSGDQPAILDLAFDRVDFPDGQSQSIDGTLTSLDSEYAMEGEDGTYTAQNDGSVYQRMAYIGYGSSDGALVGVYVDSPLSGQTLGDSLSSLSAQVPEFERQPSDITLFAGTELGVRINQTTHLTLAD